MADANQSGGRSGEVVGLDGRTWQARRIRSLASMYTAALGDSLDALTLEAVQRAAELQVTAEWLRTRSLRGEAVSANDLVKAENLADRARRALRIGNRPALTVRPIRERLAAANA
ncbi:hypothetical protein [Bradyrhizobium sp. Mp64]|uniref:hypothetical protein n=1 Tax=Bradyrhizobium sp. Mp64 TaxID=3042158 RepID=UPI00248BE6A7|nr:hypothetical protein [Bradyrhizobium sp. Mp64]MDI2103934.1 hypothetical protein [Bradyrhizobium sp. Mp64]